MIAARWASTAAFSSFVIARVGAPVRPAGNTLAGESHAVTGSLTATRPRIAADSALRHWQFVSRVVLQWTLSLSGRHDPAGQPD